MAEKRMLTRKITENDNFTSLPATAQALYVHITMSADDDGFSDQLSTAMFRAHAKQKDLKLLLEKKYLLQFESGVVVVKHWRMANALRKDRYETTAHQEEYQRLTLKPNGSYTLADKRQPDDNQESESEENPDNQLATTWQPDGNQTAPDGCPRVEKSRVEKSRVEYINAHARTREDEQDDGFTEFWTAYPRKSGDIRQAYMAYLHALGIGATQEKLIEAIKAQTDGATPEDLHFLPSAEKWLRNQGWESKASIKSERKEETAHKKKKQYTTAAEYTAQGDPTSGKSVEEIWADLDKI